MYSVLCMYVNRVRKETGSLLLRILLAEQRSLDRSKIVSLKIKNLLEIQMEIGQKWIEAKIGC